MRGRAPGDKIGDRYEIRRLLGVGGMGEVYEAMASSASGFTRRVAVKVLSSDDGSDPDVASFREEARVVARLHHGGIVGVVDFGDIAGTPFLVLEVIDGVSAGGAVRRARMPATVALAVVVDVARALHYAHTLEDEDGRPLGIVHRDVKPSNILLSWAGDVKLGDFGIALASDRSTTKTTGAFSKGTPGFMSPEQLLASPVDARTDVFALGCTLHALLAGASPLRGNDDVVRLLSGAPVNLDAGIDADVRALIARSTAAEPSARHASALAFAEDAARVLAPRLRRDARGEVAAYLAGVRGGSAAPAPTPASGPLAADTVLSRRAGTDTFTSAPRADAGGRSGAPSRATTRAFLLAVLATIGVGATFALGGVAALLWSWSHGPAELAEAPLDAAATDETDAAAEATSRPPAADSDEPDTSTDAGQRLAASPRPAARVASTSGPRQVVPEWTKDHRACPSCRCAYRTEQNGLFVTDNACKAITAPMCVCWTERTPEHWDRSLLCGTPRRADGTCDVRSVPGDEGGACRGWAHQSRDGGLLAGTWRCSTCAQDFGACTQGTPCSAMKRDGSPVSGHLRCLD